MTTDPPTEAFEDVRIGNWQGSLPSDICTNKEIFDEIFSLETWKTVLKPDQRDRVMKMLPPEVFKVPGEAEKTIEELFSKALTNFGSNPLNAVFDKLDNGHYDPEVVETKTRIVREWKRESFRLRKHYHTKLLQDIVISRENHLKKLIKEEVPHSKKNGKKSISSSNNNNNNTNKKQGKAATQSNTTNGVSTKGKNTKSVSSNSSGSPQGTNSNKVKSGEQGKNKRNRDAVLLSTPTIKDTPGDGPPSRKKAKQSSSSKSKASNKKADILIVTSQQPPQIQSSTQLSGNLVLSNSHQKSVLLGTLATAPLSTLSETTNLPLRCPSAAAPPPPPTSLLESLTAPINPPQAIDTSSSIKQYTKIFPAPGPPVLGSSITTSSPSLLPSPVQSSPILASQLQAPSPISVNLNSITSLRSTGSSSNSPSASQSSITLNYTQAPPPTVTSQSKGLMEDDSSSDEFEFETIEPTIGFSGSTIPTPKGGPSTPATSSFKMGAPATFKKGPPSTLPQQQTVTISSQQLANIQKCSLLTNCLTQPLANSSAAAAAALANNILTSDAVDISHQQIQPQKIIVTSGGSNLGLAAQLHKFIPTSSTATFTTPKLLTHQPIGGIVSCPSGATFQQKNVISTITSPSAIVTSTQAQSLVSSIIASKDILATLGSAIGSSSHQIQHSTSSPSVLPISVNLQGVTGVVQQQGLKQAFIRAQIPAGLLPAAPQQTHQILSLPPQPGQGSSLNTQSLQLPSSILSSKATCSSSSASISNLLDSNDLNLNLDSYTMGLGMNLDMGVNLSDIDGGMGGSASGVDNMKLEMECGIDKMDDLSVLDGNPFDSIPNLSDELDGLDLDMVDGLCDFEVLLSDEKQYASFFSLIRDVLCSTRDHRMTLVCMEKTIRKWAQSPGAAVNPWYHRVPDWNGALIVALNFLAGNYQDVHPEDFVPYIEYKYKTKYYQWIGAGRDGDNNLTPLCSLWMDNLGRLPPLKKAEGEGEEPEEEEDENEDSDVTTGEEAKKKNKRPQTPPPPRCTTEWTVRPSTLDEKEEFRAQEKSRFDNPHKAFTYRMHDYESVVGPVKGVYSSQTGITNKARGHSLLVDDRPPYVTILALVRDAVARLPNGEGTRSEICEMLRDSAFLAPEASSVTLNSVVSGALDRLHYERDPCVRYDSHKKSWIYLHRDRTQEQFERLHHNRSYTKSTKSRNSSNRKVRKGGSKSSPASTTTTATTTTSSSSSSSQSSLSATPIADTVFSTGVSSSTSTSSPAATTGGGIVISTSDTPLITLPPLSTISPKVHTMNSIAPKQTIGLVSVSTSHQINGSIQVQSSLTGSSVMTQSTTSSPLQQSLASRGFGGKISTLPGEILTKNIGNLQQALGEGVTQHQPSLNEVLAAAAAGLRFQHVQTTPVTSTAGVGSVGGTPVLFGPQSKSQQVQGQIIQEQVASQSQPTTRLLLQQNAQSATVVQSQQHAQTLHLQLQGGGTTPVTTSIAATPVAQASGSGNAPGLAPQILLGSSAVLKLAGNIRLGEGLRLTQLRLPGTTGTVGTASSALRLPQHRILLARGAIPGQSQAQGVLLGQTSTGQTVILSAASPTTGTLSNLQQALSHGTSTSGVGVTAQLGQIAAHTSVDSTSQLQPPGGNVQALASNSQQNLAFTTQTGATKFGIITNVGAQSGNPNSMGNTAKSGTVQVQSSYLTGPRQIATQTLQQQHTQSQGTVISTCSSTSAASISIPASMLASTQAPVSVSQSVAQGMPNISVSNSLVAQQMNVSTVVSGISTGGTINVSQAQTQIGVPTAIQLQGMPQTLQALQQSHQSHAVMAQLQSQQGSPQPQSSNAQTQAHQLAAPIIIRSAQGDFVSFGIPSHLSLARSMQGIKMFPFQAGKQTVLARIVAPGSTTVTTPTSNVSGALATVGIRSTVPVQNVNAIAVTSGTIAAVTGALTTASAGAAIMSSQHQQSPNNSAS